MTITIVQRHWNAETTEVSRKTFEWDMRYAETMGARIYERTDTDREGNPLKIVWVAGKRGGRVFTAYEITE